MDHARKPTSAVSALEETDKRRPALSELLSFSQAAKGLPSRRGGRPTHASTIHRWAKRGSHGVKLRTICVGGQHCTTENWLMDFFETTTSVTQSPAARAHLPTPSKSNQRDVDCGIDLSLRRQAQNDAELYEAIERDDSTHYPTPNRKEGGTNDNS